MSITDRESRPDKGSFTITEWCTFRRVSPAMFYKLDAQGLAPRSHYVGAKRLISDAADLEWIAAREEAAHGTAA